MDGRIFQMNFQNGVEERGRTFEASLTLIIGKSNFNHFINPSIMQS